MEDNNVVMSFNIMPQNLKAKDEKFPLTFKVFKVRQPALGLALSDICVFLVQREKLTRLGDFMNYLRHKTQRAIEFTWFNSKFTGKPERRSG